MDQKEKRKLEGRIREITNDFEVTFFSHIIVPKRKERCFER
jgi:hypothetical protein